MFFVIEMPLTLCYPSPAKIKIRWNRSFSNMRGMFSPTDILDVKNKKLYGSRTGTNHLSVLDMDLITQGGF